MNFQLADFILKGTALLYFLSMAGYLLFLFFQKPFYQRSAFFLILSGIIFHFIYIIIYTITAGHLPIQNLSQSLSMTALAIGCMFLFFQYRLDLKILGVFASLLLFIIMMAVLIIPNTPIENNEILKGLWLYIHIILVFAGNAALGLASGAGILYLLQEKGIKQKSPGFFFKRLPSLDLLDNVGYTCVTTGFALLTIGLAIGFIYAKTIWGKFWSWDPKEVFSIGAWLFYAVLLHLRFYYGLRGKKAAIITLIGFFIIIFTFLGVNILIGGHHQPFTK